MNNFGILTILPLLFVIISISFSSLKSLVNICLLKTCRYTQVEQSEQPVSISVEENAEPDKLKSTPASKYYISPSKYNYQLLITSLIQLFIVVSRAIAIETSGGDNSSGRNVEPIVTVAVWTYIAFLAFLNRTSQARLYELRFFYIMLSAADFLKLRSQLFVETHALNYIIETIFNSAVLLLDVYLMINSLQLTKKITKLNSNALNEKIYPSTEMYSSIFSRLTFEWIDPLLNYGYKNTINLEDVWAMDEKQRTSFLSDDFENFESKATSLEGRLFSYFLIPLLYQSFWCISDILIEFLNPYLLYLFLNFIGVSSDDGITKDFYTSVEFGFYLICGMLATKFIKAVTATRAQLIGTRLGICIEIIAIGEVYKKILKRKDRFSVKEDEESSSSGKIANLVSVDCNELAVACSSFESIYTIPIQVTVSLISLYLVLGWTAFVALGISLLMIPINNMISSWWDTFQQKYMAASDKRISNINELIQGIRIIKFFAWEDRFSSKIKESRDAELKLLTIRTMFWALTSIFWYCFPITLTCVSFFVYTKIAGNNLNSPTAFTALLVLNMLHASTSSISGIFDTLVQVKVALRRINKFLNEEDTSKYDILIASTTSSDQIIGFKNATLEWEAVEASSQDFDESESESESENENSGGNSSASSIALDANPGFKIINLNLSFPEKELSIIAGPTGCGKTSMLLGLLGEMSLTSGQVFLPKKFPVTNNQHDHDFSLNGGIAYVSQTAWIQQATIRDNILFGEPFNQQRYSQVIKICALLPDFQTLTDGDLTEVGEKGITLSGGQKQRVSLARAVYSRASHIIMDDCLSAVDAHTAKHLFHQCIMGDIMKGRTRILVTHNISLTFLHASYAVVMGNNGTISGAGKPEDLSELKEIKDELNSKFQATSDEDLQAAATDNIFNLNVEADPAKKLVEDEERAIGRVKLSIYFAYLKAVGGIPYWIIFFVLYALNSILPLILDWWMKIWVDSYDKSIKMGVFSAGIKYVSGFFNFSAFKGNIRYINSIVYSYLLLPLDYKRTKFIDSVFIVSNSDDELNYYITIYIAIGLSIATTFSLRDIYQLYGSLKASRYFHDSMLHKVLRAPIRFFDTTPIGRIVNRFSKDIEAIDGELMSSTEFIITEALSMIFTMLFIIAIIPAFLLPVLVICFIYYRVTQYYIGLSRELNRLESVTRSPIHTHCSETINGLIVIRAFEQESRFIRNSNFLIDNNIKSFFFMTITNLWLEIRGDIIASIIVFFCGLLLLVIRDRIGAATAGFALNCAINFTYQVHYFFRLYSNAEMSLNSVERIIEYLELESEAPRVLEDNRPPSEWPQNGHIEIKDLVLRYAKDLDPVIKGISLEIFAGEKIGVVGRTGAGKSTLALAFFRFLEATEGSITIDGVDISKIGVKDLRSNLTIIPQEAILFSGTIRSNLDPFSEHSDEDLWKVLKRVHIVDREYEPSQNSSTEDIPADMETSFSVESDTSQQKHVAIKSLDQAVAENGQNFSQGQRQLLSLARALLRHSKVIIMDEATASVDYQTDAEIQRTIREEFQTNSLICIAHRLRTIIDYDKVLVMDKGTVAEFDTPYNLLYKSGGIFRGMCQESGEMEQLENLVTKPDDLINV